MDTDAAEFLPLLMKMRAAMITHAVYEQRYEFNNLRQNVSPAVLRTDAQAGEGTGALAPTHPRGGVE